MIRRTEFDPMSMTATGGPRSSRPRAACPARLGALAPANEAAGGRVFKRFSTAGQAWIGHEIFMGIERLLAGCSLYARRCAVRQELPALLVVLEIGDHDLVEHLLVHGRIEHRAQHLDPAIELTRMRSESPGTPGRRQQIPRTTRSTSTPAREAA